jgi:anti-anti-sigma factor
MFNDPALPAHTLTFTTQAWPEWTIIRCAGRLTIETAPQLKSQVTPLLVNKACVVLDLTDLQQMDSSGLGAIVSLYISSKRAGCQMQLINLSARVRELLSMSNLVSLFEGCGRYGARMP